MEEILHRLIGCLSIFTKVLYIPGGDRRISSINSYHHFSGGYRILHVFDIGEATRFFFAPPKKHHRFWGSVF